MIAALTSYERELICGGENNCACTGLSPGAKGKAFEVKVLVDCAVECCQRGLSHWVFVAKENATLENKDVIMGTC